MMDSVFVRVARYEDIPSIQRVASVTWWVTYAGQIPDLDIEQFLDSAYSERNLAAEVGRLANGFVVAEVDGIVAGYAMAGPNREGEPELYAIYVLPEHHGRGVGRLLWNAARDALARQGYTRMCCWVLASNDRARRFYERQGAFLSEERSFVIGATTIREARYCIAIAR